MLEWQILQGILCGEALCPGRRKAAYLNAKIRIRMTIFVLQRVQRQTLRDIMPNAGAVFENLFKTLEITEPAFKEVVVLYRFPPLSIRCRLSSACHLLDCGGWVGQTLCSYYKWQV